MIRKSKYHLVLILAILAGIFTAVPDDPPLATEESSARAEALLTEIVTARPGTLEELQRPYKELGKLGTAAVPAIIRTINDPDLNGATKASLISVLGEIGGPETVEELAKQARASHPTIRYAVYNSLARIGDAAAAKTLFDIYSQPTLSEMDLDDYYLEEAASSITNKDAIPVLMTALEDRSAATDASGEILRWPCLLAMDVLTKLPLSEAQAKRAGDAIERIITNNKYNSVRARGIMALPKIEDKNAAKHRLERIEKLDLSAASKTAVKNAKQLVE